MVVFATPGMLHAGLSLQIFKRWAPSEQNMVKRNFFLNSSTLAMVDLKKKIYSWAIVIVR